MLINARRLCQGEPATELVLLAIEDITERKRMMKSLVRQAARDRKLKESLERQVAELDAFTHSVSHDLKEPLRAIAAFSQFVLEDYADRLNEQGREYLLKVANAAARMKKLIENKPTLSQASLQPNPPSRVDLVGWSGK